MKPRIGKPFIWTTWITGLLANTDKCAWKVWVRSHFHIPKKEEDEDSKERLSTWVKEHDAMTARRAEKLTAEGYTVSLEDANSFSLRGEVADLAGKPDILAINHEKQTVLIIDEKSGKQKEQYIWQVLIYMFAKSFVYPTHEISGEIEYKTESILIHPRQLNAQNKSRIGNVMKIVGGKPEPPRVPSRYECGYCDILSCPDRWVDADASAHF